MYLPGMFLLYSALSTVDITPSKLLLLLIALLLCVLSTLLYVPPESKVGYTFQVFVYTQLYFMPRCLIRCNKNNKMDINRPTYECAKLLAL